MVEFYPSILEDLLNRARQFAKDHIDIGDDEVAIIQHSRKSLLFSKDKAWVKKEGPGLFEVAVGSYDGAEVCELVGIFVLSHFPEQYDRNSIGLYRDDRLAVFRDISGRAGERIRKNIVKSFNDLGLHITIQATLRTVNFLDVTFSLCSGKYYPYRKPNDKPLYINRLLNHPPPPIDSAEAARSHQSTPD